MSRWLVFASLIACAAPAAAQENPADRSEQLLEKAHRLVAVDADGCLKTYNAKEIVVCGKFDANRKHRLPFPELAVDPGKRIRQAIPNGNPEIVQQGKCYVTMNERNCHSGKLISVTMGGGKGVSVGTPAGRLWRVIEAPENEESFIKKSQMDDSPAD